MIECYNCKSKGHQFFAKENGFNLVECNNCKLLFVENPPSFSQISTSNEQGLHKGDDDLNVTGSFNQTKISFYKEMIACLFNINELKSKNWLDIGCGYGELLMTLNNISKNITALGSEPNKVKSAFAQSKGLDVGFIDIKEINTKYDVISLLNVYSHLPNPVDFLKTLKSKLNVSGELLIETGDITYYNPKNIPRPLYLPDHLSFTTEKNLIELLEGLGFEIVGIKKYPIINKNIKTFLKEFVKLILPNYTTRIHYFFYDDNLLNTDMYIRAKLK